MKYKTFIIASKNYIPSTNLMKHANTSTVKLQNIIERN